MALSYRSILFDLDGTLLESGEGIMGVVLETLKHFGYPAPPPEQLRRYVGPPSHESYERLAGMPHELAMQAGRLHRSLYRAGMWRRCRLYPGVEELLRDLRRAGARLAVASAKPRPAAEMTVAEFFRPGTFHFLSCADNDGGGQKSDLILRALSAMGETERSRAVMIGDTRYDAEGARQAGVPFLGVLYGYGTRAEQEAEGATRFASTVGELRSLLLPSSQDPALL